MFTILTRGDTPHGNADMAKLADAHDSGSCGKPCRFKSCYPHQINTYPKGWVFIWCVKINRTWLSFDGLALLG